MAHIVHLTFFLANTPISIPIRDRMTMLTSCGIIFVIASLFANVQNYLATMRPDEYEVLEKLGMNHLVLRYLMRLIHV